MMQSVQQDFAFSVSSSQKATLGTETKGSEACQTVSIVMLQHAAYVARRQELSMQALTAMATHKARLSMQALTSVVTHRAAKHSRLRLTNLTWFVAVCISSIHSSRAFVGIIRNRLAGQERLFAFLTQPLGTSLWL